MKLTTNVKIKLILSLIFLSITIGLKQKKIDKGIILQYYN